MARGERTGEGDALPLPAKGAPGAREAERARIVVLAAEAVPGKQIAEPVGWSMPTVALWRSRFAAPGSFGLAEAHRSGKQPTVPRTAGGLHPTRARVGYDVAANSAIPLPHRYLPSDAVARRAG